MKLYTMILSRRPIGRLLGEISAILSKCDATQPQRLTIAHKSFGNVDESQTFANQLVNEQCRISLKSGECVIHWNHSPDAREQIITLIADLDADAIAPFRKLLSELCVQISATYALSDLDHAIDSDQWSMGTWPITPTAVESICWFNFFGHEYQSDLPLLENVVESVWQLERVSDGATIVLLTESPEERADARRLREIDKAWPVFRSLRQAARFHRAIEPDLFEVRNAPLPAGQFILGCARVETAARYRWLVEQGLVHDEAGRSKPFHLIRPKFCRAAGINVDDMIVLLFDEREATFFDERIKAAYETAENGLPERDRIWCAHQAAYRGRISSEILSFIKTHFFSDVE